MTKRKNAIDWNKPITNPAGTEATVHKDLGEEEKFRYFVRIGDRSVLHLLDSNGRDMMGQRRVSCNIRIEKEEPYKDKKNAFVTRLKNIEDRLKVIENSLGI